MPNLFLIGAPKAGTSAVAQELSNHGSIFVPINKEPRFFDAHVFYDDPRDYPLKNLSDYLGMYQSQTALNSSYRLDASVFNMYSDESISRILEVSPRAKFILVLRDPLEATKSMFLQRLKYPPGPMREVSDDFEVCWRAIKDRQRGGGLPVECKARMIFRYDLLYAYEKYIPSLLKLIPDEQLCILRYEDLRKDHMFFYSRLFDFLDIPITRVIKNTRVNKSQVYQYSKSLKLLSFLAGASRPARRMFGLTGVLSLSDFVKPVPVDREQFNLDSIDSEIRRGFAGTYDFLKEQGFYT